MTKQRFQFGSNQAIETLCMPENVIPFHEFLAYSVLKTPPNKLDLTLSAKMLLYTLLTEGHKQRHKNNIITHLTYDDLMFMLNVGRSRISRLATELRHKKYISVDKNTVSAQIFNFYIHTDTIHKMCGR